jgi:hypothetical protein
MTKEQMRDGLIGKELLGQKDHVSGKESPGRVVYESVKGKIEERNKQLEQEAAERKRFQSLPKEQQDAEVKAFWDEFLEGEAADANQKTPKQPEAEGGRVAPSVAPAAKTGKETDLLGDDTQAIAGRQALADREREQDAKRNGLTQDAPDAAGFNLTGSDSARDQAAAAGQTELPLSAPAQETTDTPINSPSKKDQRKLKSLKLERVSAKGTVEIAAADLLSLADEKLDKVADMLRKCGG